jgi:hypothetical protein
MTGRPPDLVVISPLKNWACAACAEADGELLVMDDRGPLCLSCADLGHLVFLPSGDAAITRRARKHSRLSAVVVRWSRARRRYERQGVLVERPAIEQAEAECLADEEARARRRVRDAERRRDEDVEFQRELEREIHHLFPRCPRARLREIATHTGERGSGRVGRTAAARALDPEAVTLAVVAAIRHGDTDYDDLLMRGLERGEARRRVRAEIERTLEAWRGGADVGGLGPKQP